MKGHNSNKKAVVLAASKGLGKAVAEKFASLGYDLAICSSKIENVDAAAGQLTSQFQVDVLTGQVDLSKKDQLNDFFSRVLKTWGAVDILVTNAGGPPVKSFDETSETEWLESTQSILMSVIASVRNVLPGMIKKNYGKIVAITSLSVKQPFPGLIYSNTLRPAVAGLMKTLSVEYGKHNISFHTVCPGFFDTDGLKRIVTKRVKNGERENEIYAEWKKSVPLSRIGRPEELADLVAFLASEKADYLSGNVIQIDGGRYTGLI